MASAAAAAGAAAVVSTTAATAATAAAAAAAAAAPMRPVAGSKRSQLHTADSDDSTPSAAKKQRGSDSDNADDEKSDGREKSVAAVVDPDAFFRDMHPPPGAVEWVHWQDIPRLELAVREVWWRLEEADTARGNTTRRGGMYMYIALAELGLFQVGDPICVRINTPGQWLRSVIKRVNGRSTPTIQLVVEHPDQYEATDITLNLRTQRAGDTEAGVNNIHVSPKRRDAVLAGLDARLQHILKCPISVDGNGLAHFQSEQPSGSVAVAAARQSAPAPAVLPMELRPPDRTNPLIPVWAVGKGTWDPSTATWTKHLHCDGCEAGCSDCLPEQKAAWKARCAEVAAAMKALKASKP